MVAVIGEEAEAKTDSARQADGDRADADQSSQCEPTCVHAPSLERARFDAQVFGRDRKCFHEAAVADRLTELLDQLQFAATGGAGCTIEQ